MKILHVDTETTGIDAPECGLTQLAGILEIPGKSPIEFDYKMRPYPQDRIDREALEVQNITMEELMARQDPKEAFRSFEKLLEANIDRYNKRDKAFIIAYNAGFDSDHMRAWFAKSGSNFFGAFFWTPPFCTMVLAGIQLAPIRHLMPDFKLGTVAKKLNIEVEGNLHDALKDVKISKGLWEKYGIPSTIPNLSGEHGNLNNYPRAILTR